MQPTAKVVGPIVQEPETGGTGNAYLQSFLSASDGAVGTGKDWIDVCGIHMYPPKYNYQVHANQISNVQASLTAAGVGSLEIWKHGNRRASGRYDRECDAGEMVASFHHVVRCTRCRQVLVVLV